MIVSRLILKNWRNFQSVDVALGERVFLAGPNASGKSNLLDVFRFLRDIVVNGLQRAVRDRGGVSKIRCLSARRPPDIEIRIQFSNAGEQEPLWEYAIGIKQKGGGYRAFQPYLSYEKVWKSGQIIINRPDESDKTDALRLTQTHLEQINANAEFREISKFLESVLYLHLVPQLLRYSKEFSGPGIPGDPFGRSFLERVSRTSERTRSARLKKIESALAIAVPKLEQLSYVIDTEEGGIPHLEVLYKHWRMHGAKQREDQFSDGTLRLIGLLWSLLESDSLLLLEEPELSLNTAIVKKLPALIYRLQKQKNRQVVLSTHSADLLSDKGIAGDEVLLLVPGQEGTQVQLASSNKEIRAMLEGGLSIADAALPFTAPDNIEQLEIFQ
ncbi:MAG: AAA family ATPase [bacterium]|jgi:predicted ATPase|nr:AAA family ATPase [bacterium]